MGPRAASRFLCVLRDFLGALLRLKAVGFDNREYPTVRYRTIAGLAAQFSTIFRETPDEGSGLSRQNENMPAGRRPEHAPSSAAGQGLFLNWRILLRRWYPEMLS